VLIFCLTEAHWRTLAKLMGQEELIANPEYRDHGTRMKYVEEIDEMVSSWTRPQRRDDIIRILIETGVPCAPVREVEEVIADPEVTERGTLVDSTYPTRGVIKVAGSPVKMSAIAREEMPRGRPPELGEHTAEVLTSIGISPERIAQLRQDGAI
jgi:CoA:oxalate CoA-transferase